MSAEPSANLQVSPTSHRRARMLDFLESRKLQILQGFVYLLLAWTFASVYDRIVPDNLCESVRELSEFNSRLPMQLRVLAPAVIHVVSAVSHISVLSASKLVTVASVWSILMLFAAFLQKYIPRAVSKIAAPLILIPLIWNYCILSQFHYPSDLPSIAFFLGCIVLWRDGRVLAYYICFAFACFNRESVLFVVPCVFVLSIAERPFRFNTIRKWGFWVIHGLAQIALWVAVKLLLSYVFRNSPGTPFEDQLDRNLLVLRHFMDSPGLLRFFLVLFGGMHVLALLMWRWNPRDLRSLLLVSVLFWPIMLYTGLLLESRIYGELIPIYTASAMAGAAALVGRKGHSEAAL